MLHLRARQIAVILAFAFAAGCFAPNPTRKPQDLGGEHVSFTTSDGILLRGHLYGTGSNGVILAHMYGGGGGALLGWRSWRYDFIPDMSAVTVALL